MFRKLTSPLFFIGILLLTFTNCKTPNYISNSKTSLGEISNFIGEFENLYLDSLGNKHAFWNKLKPFPTEEKNSFIGDSSSFFKIEILSKDKIEFSLYVRDELKEKKIFKYQFENNTLEIKKRKNKKLKGVPLIFYTYRGVGLKFTLDENKDLILDYDGGASGGILILIIGGPILGQSTFQRIN